MTENNKSVEKKYKIGICIFAYAGCTRDFFRKIKSCAMQCQRFVICVPSAGAMGYVSGDDEDDSSDDAVSFWKAVPFVDEVIVCAPDELFYQSIYKKIQFDVCFYGSEYGLQFQKDKIFFLNNNIDFISLAPSLPIFDSDITADALYSLLMACKSSGMKIITFGSGAYFERYMSVFGALFPPAYTIDNNSNVWGQMKNGITICSPKCLENENPSAVFIIICIKKSDSIVEQLYKINEFDYRTLFYVKEIACAENIPFIKSNIEKSKHVLAKIQQINYDLLKEYDAICTKHNIEYFINYGTLLGAIRHKGFIPWDNDVDVIMKCSELDKLRQFKHEFSDLYYWLSPEMLGKRKYFDSVSRIGYKNAYIRKSDGSAEYYLNYYNGIHLDLFLVDKTYDNFKGKLQRLELAVLYGLMNAYRHKSLFFDYDKKMRTFNCILRFCGRFIPLSVLRVLVDKVAKRFDNDEKAPYYFISNCALNKLWLLFPNTVFDKPPVRLRFGELMVSASSEYDLMCKKIFGNYMTLPPREQRIPHCGRELLNSDLFVFEAPEKRGY